MWRPTQRKRVPLTLQLGFALRKALGRKAQDAERATNYQPGRSYQCGADQGARQTSRRQETRCQSPGNEIAAPTTKPQPRVRDPHAYRAQEDRDHRKDWPRNRIRTKRRAQDGPTNDAARDSEGKAKPDRERTVKQESRQRPRRSSRV